MADGGVSVTGNSRKNMIHSAEASLRRLGTDRIDLYWVDFPDAVTPIDEIVLRLDDLSRKGKIIYAGFSDFPAWRVALGATLAECVAGHPSPACRSSTAWSKEPPSANFCPWRPLLARIRAEERLLHKQFGDEYGAYCARTSRLVSGLY